MKLNRRVFIVFLSATIFFLGGCASNNTVASNEAQNAEKTKAVSDGSAGGCTKQTGSRIGKRC